MNSTNSIRSWFNRGFRLDREINALEESKHELFTRITNTTMNYSGESVDTTKDPHKYDSYIAFCAQVDKRVDELITAKGEILSVIEKIDNTQQRTVLILRYVNFWDWKAIANFCGVKERRVYDIHAAALSKAEKILINLKNISKVQ